MYSLNVEPQNTRQPVINRSMSSNAAIELIPVMIEICRSEFNMIEPVALSMGDNVYRIFDIYNPSVYAMVSIIKDAN